MASRAIGRPMKYYYVIANLKDDCLYSPASIARFAHENEFFDYSSPEELKQILMRIRLSMGRLANYHAFPNHGDGQVVTPGQRPLPAWFGWRWKIILEGNYAKAQR